MPLQMGTKSRSLSRSFIATLRCDCTQIEALRSARALFLSHFHVGSSSQNLEAVHTSETGDNASQRGKRLSSSVTKILET